MPITRNKGDDELHATIKIILKKICASDEFISQLSETVSEIMEKKFKKKLKPIEEKISELEETIENQSKLIDALEKRNEYYEKYTRKNNIVLFGLSVNGSENHKVSDAVLNVLNDKMKLGIQNTDIEGCYKLGNNKNSQFW